MQSKTAPHPTNTRPAEALIAQNYRAIGPAAVLAALIFMPKARTKHALPQPAKAA